LSLWSFFGFEKERRGKEANLGGLAKDKLGETQNGVHQTRKANGTKGGGEGVAKGSEGGVSHSGSRVVPVVVPVASDLGDDEGLGVVDNRGRPQVHEHQESREHVR